LISLMRKKLTRYLYLLLVFLPPLTVLSQTTDRIQVIQEKLETLSATVPGLKQKVQLSVTGVSLQEYLNALGTANGLSLSVDPKLNFKIYNNFNNITAINILVFLAKEYKLDIAPVGAIIVVRPYEDPNQFIRPPLKEITANYSQLNNTLSLELSNDSLTKVAKRITQLSGKNVVVPLSLQGKVVSGYFAAAPFDAALEKLAYSNSIKMVKTNDSFYLFEPLGEGEELYVTGDQRTGVRKAYKPLNTSGGGGSSGILSRTVNGQKLLSVDASNTPILDLVKAASQEMNNSYFMYSDLKGSISAHIRDMSYDNFLTSLFQGTEYTYAKQNEVYLIGDRKLEGLRTNKVIQLQNRSIDTILAMIPNDWKRGIEIKEFREQNTLLISGSRPQIEEIASFVHQLDILVPVVLIEVTLVDVHKSRTVSTGIKAGVADSVKTGGTVFPGLDYTFGSRSINEFLTRIGKATSTNLGQVTPNFYVQLSALESNDNIDVRSVPKLSTLNGHPAKLSIGSTRYYSLKNQSIYPSISGTQNVITQEYKETKADLNINIRPVVSGDDQVTLGIKVEISDFIGTPPNDAPSPKSTSSFESIVRAHTDDMIVLGGIERTENSEFGSGVPFLSRIPILKWLFSSRSKTTSKVVTVVFIKPTIVR
jgi:type IV pilus assembly protein PilQ